MFLNALENCYSTFKQKALKQSNWEPKYFDFDYFCFHTPFSKMVQKAFFHLLFKDIERYASQGVFPKKVVDEMKSN